MVSLIRGWFFRQTPSVLLVFQSCSPVEDDGRRRRGRFAYHSTNEKILSVRRDVEFMENRSIGQHPRLEKSFWWTEFQLRTTRLDCNGHHLTVTGDIE